MKNVWFSPILLIGAVVAPEGTVLAEGGRDPAPITLQTLWDFENGELPGGIAMNNASVVPTGDHGGARALHVHLNARDHMYSGFSITFDRPRDWDVGNEVGLALDLKNPGNRSIQLYLELSDVSGKSFTRSAVVAPHGDATFYAVLKGGELALESGLREAPSRWRSDASPFIWMWGTKQLDLKRIKALSISAIGLDADRAFLVDNVRLVRPAAIDAGHLTAIVDRYGQTAKSDFPGKVGSVDAMQGDAQREGAELAKSRFEDRSRFGGWKAGPKRAATGFFRTEKLDGKWWLIDPDGYLYFATGIDNVRMSNLNTMTGIDFDEAAIVQRTATDVTPEDSRGLERVPDAALPSRYVRSPLRRSMFEWLPNYDEPLGGHFGYRREVHQGAVPRGETFNFYRANLERKYSGDEKHFMGRWRDVTVDRMLGWGFTSFGNWLDPSFYGNGRLPFFANGWIIGDFKTVSSGDDYWAPLPDPFDPEFARRADVTAARIAEEVANSPWCVGIFIDNEKSWGRMGSVEGQYGIVIDTLARSAEQSPAKQAFTRLLRDKYVQISKLNSAWGTQIPNWELLGSGFKAVQHNAALESDYAMLLEAFAARYFEIVRGASKRFMPNHLYLGVRFATWGMTPEVVRAAARYTDVLSYNEYRETLHEEQWSFLRRLDKPSIIGEFHIGAPDAGLFHPGLVMASDQRERALMFESYMNTIIEHPQFVGAHWFQYIDSPLAGREYDGENYNVGFVSVADRPYPELVEAAKRVNAALYRKRFAAKVEGY